MRIIIFCIAVFLYFDALAHKSEKIHLHLDKDIYLPGETIWFKAYLLYNNQPSFLSTNFYIAIYDDDGKLMLQKQYPVFNGSCYGEIALPDSLPAKSIRIRVATKGILLSNTSNYYERVVTIFQQVKTKSKVIFANQPVLLQFLPEGGSVIAGFQNVFAIKATNTLGEPTQVSGKIIESITGNFIDSFFTDITGLGKISMLPKTDKSYLAIWLTTDRIINTTEIIKNAETGALLHCERSENILYCNIMKSNSGTRFNTLKLLITTSGEEIITDSVEMKDRVQWIYKIPVDSLPAGVLQFTLLDAFDIPLQKRMILNANLPSYNKLAVDIGEKNLSPKGENVFTIKIADSLRYNLSVSVSDINFCKSENQIQIEQDFWLSSNILPDIATTKKVLQENSTENLNLLLITAKTNGTVSRLPVFSKPLDNYLSLEVKYQRKDYALPKGSDLNLIVKDIIQGKQFFKLTASSQVDFVKEGLVFFDSAQVNYQLDKNKEETNFLTIAVEEKYTTPRFISKMSFPEMDTVSAAENINIESPIIDFLVRKPKKFNEEKSLKEVVVKSKYYNPETKRLQELESKYTSGMFSGITRGYQLNVIDDKNAWSQSDILNYIFYRVPSVKICTIGGERILMNTRVNNQDCNIANAIPTFLNETELPQQTGLSNIPVSQIAYIKYIPGIVINSTLVSGGGALYIYTKKGDEIVADNNSVMSKVKLKGYDVAKTFTSPDYTDKKNLLNSDIRTTLYWNPYLIMDKVNNKYTIKFNNNDVSKKLLLTIEGFTEEGKLVHIEKVIEN
ncbi:MAG: hypothetical protein ABI685_06580 [Ferruginibacter sp.]